jgi:hypothetical protein
VKRGDGARVALQGALEGERAGKNEGISHFVLMLS